VLTQRNTTAPVEIVGTIVLAIVPFIVVGAYLLHYNSRHPPGSTTGRWREPLRAR